MMKKNNKGFSLIELMTVVGVLVMIAIIAIPAYNTYIRKSRRLEGQTNILKIQAAYEEYFAQNNTYPASNTLPPASTIPDTTYYKYNSTTSSTSYSITASGLGTQANDKEGTATCGSGMTLDNLGTQTPATCWPQ